MSCVIAIVNQKGGVGKTTTTVNLAYALLKSHKSVLTIDFDPQASLTDYFGFDPTELEDQEKTIYSALIDNRPMEELVIAEKTADKPALIASGIKLANTEPFLMSQSWNAGSILRGKMEQIRKQYDVVLIDCPPTLTLLTVNALAAADAVLIPVKTDRMSTRGIELLIPTISNISDQLNPNLKIIGVLPTLFNGGFKHDQKYLKELQEGVGSVGIKVFMPIHKSTVFDQAVEEHKPTLELSPDTPGVSHHYQVANYIIHNYLNQNYA